MVSSVSIITLVVKVVGLVLHISFLGEKIVIYVMGKK